MKRIIRLTESDLTRIVRRVMNEQLTKKEDIKSFQDYMDTIGPWVKKGKKYSKLNKGVGYGNFGPNTKAAGKVYGKKYQESKKSSEKSEKKPTKIEKGKPVIPKKGMKVIAANVVALYMGGPVTSVNWFDSYVVEGVETAECYEEGYVVKFKDPKLIGSSYDYRYLLFVPGHPTYIDDRDTYVNYDIKGDGGDYLEKPNWCKKIAVDRVGIGDFIK